MDLLLAISDRPQGKLALPIPHERGGLFPLSELRTPRPRQSRRRGGFARIAPRGEGSTGAGPGLGSGDDVGDRQCHQRFGDSTDASLEGVGLGMAVARGFVEAMGGEIVLDDTPGGGLTVTVLLPQVLP
jgi:hypothetical protein